MALTRAPRPKSPGLQMEPVQEVNVEAQLLSMMQGLVNKVDAVKEGVDGAKGQIRDMRTVLLGSGDNGETEHGRIPMIERAVADHGSRIGRLEKIYVRWGGIVATLLAVLLTVKWIIELIVGHW